VKLGNPALAQANRQVARERAEPLCPVLEELRGRPLRAIADELNSRGITTPSGASAMQVHRALRRLDLR
jgi:hypothetical protein